MQPTFEATSAPVDLSNCDREPIHIPGFVQAHGVVLALAEPALTITQASANTLELLGRPARAVLGLPVAELFPGPQGESLREALATPLLDDNPLFVMSLTAAAPSGERRFHAIAHRHDGVLVLELEPATATQGVSFRDLYPLVRTFMAGLHGVTDVATLCQLAAAELRRVTGFDRVLVYQFDAECNGVVVAEERDESLTPYLDLRFPASDIPRQARELYRLNRVRVIADAGYRPVPLVPALNPGTGRPLDLSYAALRGVSPVHVEYLKNMGVVASMSVAVVPQGRLWGLLSCHHKTPRAVPYEVRAACDFLAQMLALQLAAQEGRAEYQHRIELKAIQARLLAYMAAEDDFAQGLANHPNDLLRFAEAGGAAILFAGRCTLLGQTPTEEQVRRLADWVAARERTEVFSSDRLAEEFPEAAGYRDRASGLLSIAVSKLHNSFVLWFRPEVVRTVKWGGDPRKAVEPGVGDGRLHPRKSFELWKEVVRGRSLPWRPAELATAVELRNDIIGIVLRQAEELAALSAELARSNQELEAFSYSVSHDLRAPFRHIVGYGELLREMEAGHLNPTARRYLDTMLESARYAGTLVDHLLGFAKMSRTALLPTAVDLNRLAREVREEVQPEAEGRAIDWRVGELPAVRADLTMLRLVLRNLVSNAVKYTRPKADARVEIGAKDHPGETVVFVRDNGVGFDMRYADKLFGVFQRLHRVEDFEGHGIGLANVRRIISRHGGRTWAEGRPGEGATFYFTLPKQEGE